MQKLKPHLDIVLNFLIDGEELNDLPITDAIFIFGHYHSEIALQAAKLWKAKKAPKIVISGGGKNRILEEFDNEAEYLEKIILEQGVLPKALILEKKASNTLENVKFGIQACHQNNFFPNSLILCAMPPLLKRACLTFKKQFPNINIYGSKFDMPRDWFIASKIKRVLEELDRIEEYGDKGDVSKIEIPKNVLKAAEAIKNLL